MSRTVAAPSSGLLLPGMILAALLATIGLQTGAIEMPRFAPRVSGSDTVLVATRPFSYRASGDFIRNGVPVDGPLIEVEAPMPLEIMRFPVSAADYNQCVGAGACAKAEPRRRGKGNVAATGINFNDATDYAQWLSNRTGDAWRLPTVEEWVFAAGNKATDNALGLEANAEDPAKRWLLAYEREAAVGAEGMAEPRPLGSLGANEYGVADLSGPVWEWTATCGSRTVMDAAGTVVSNLDSCGVHYLEGRHRTAMTNFVRDAIAGGCSIGVPPDNLGFRLVRQRSL